MPWPVYSERLLRAGPTIADGAYVTVPTGYRMIVTEMAFTNSGAVAGQVTVHVAGTWYYDHKFLAGERAFIQPCRVVLYAGEKLVCGKEFASLGLVASGYLLQEGAGVDRVQLERVEIDLEHGEQLPAPPAGG